MPQNSITAHHQNPNNMLPQQQQTAVLNSVQGSTMVDPNLLREQTSTIQRNTV